MLIDFLMTNVASSCYKATDESKCKIGGLVLRNEGDIELRELRIFLAIAQSQTLTEAARRLGVTQSAVSQVLKQMERHVGAKLVQRRSNPLVLTASGVALATHAQQILANVKQITSAVRMASGEKLPQLRLGLIDSVASSAARPLLDRIDDKAHTISLKTGLTSRLDNTFKTGEIDILISADVMEAVHGLELHPVIRDPFVLVYSRKMLNSDTADVHQLSASYPLIRYNRQSGLGNSTSIMLRRLLLDVHDRFEFDSTQTLMDFVQAGEGWSLVTGLCLLQHPELLEGVVIQSLGESSARWITLKARTGELGNLPTEIAQHCRCVFTEILHPKLVAIAPCLETEATAITELPPF